MTRMLEIRSFGLVEGVGSEDNAAFTISGNVLSPLVSFDRSQKDTYSIRLSVVDSTGLSFDQNFSITILPDPSGDESGVSLIQFRISRLVPLRWQCV